MSKKEYESAKASEAPEAAAETKAAEAEQAATNSAQEAEAATDNASDNVTADTEADNIKQQLDELQAQLDNEKKEYLFLMAEFDNYRKRVLREKADMLKNAAEKTLLGILPVVDDFERGMAATDKIDAENSAALSLREGMTLIYNKIIKYLGDNGVKAMESTGAAFDADLHEAIAMVPAASDDLKGKVIDTVQKGYMLNDKVLRHAKVAVGE